MKYEIWLGNKYYMFDHGIACMDDGRTEPLGMYYSSCLTRDAITIGRPSEFGYPADSVRCYPYPGVLEFSHIDDVDFLIHNASNRDIYICYYAYLRPGESVEITSSTPKPHYNYLARWEPVALCRFVATSNKDVQELVGHYGLLVKQICFDRNNKKDFGKTYTRFLLADFLQNADAENEGLETSPGMLSFTKDGEAVLSTKNNRYVYKYKEG